MGNYRQLGKLIPAPGLFILDGLCQYTGSAIAIALAFPLLSGRGAAWWRVALAALMLLAWRRPWRQGLTCRQLRSSALVGLAITLMNMTFYEAISRIDMGTTVSIEFLGPVLIAVITGKGWIPRIGALLGLAGVVSIGGFGLDITDPTQRVGFALSLLAGVFLFAYILGGSKIAQARSGIDSLAIGLAAGALFTFPLALPDLIPPFSNWHLAGALFLVALLATAIPFSLEQVIMHRLGSVLYSLLSAIMPATSAVVGAVLLRQLPSAGELVGICLISIAVLVVNLGPKRRPKATLTN